MTNDDYEPAKNDDYEPEEKDDYKPYENDDYELPRQPATEPDEDDF